MKRLMILGSIKYFENIVMSAKKEGIYTIVCDNRINTPAKKICDESIDVDVFDFNKIKNIAIDKKIDGVLTGFTDSLMEPYSYIANELNLPCVICCNQLESVTNKSVMKAYFKENNIPTTNYCVIESLKEIEKIQGLKFPLVVKPADGYGSRGVYFTADIDELIEKFKFSKETSQNGQVIIEEFYESDEIQGLAWVYNGESHVFYIGDRELVNIHEGRAGKPDRLLYPSKYCFQYEEEIKSIYQKITEVFNIKNGPLYVQMLVGVDGIKVSEVMPRLPGGCDYLAISQITDLDIGRLFANFSVNNHIDFDKIKKYNMNLSKCVYALPIYIRPGTIKKINNIDKIENLDYVTQILLLVKEGDTIELYEDERQDCGRIYGIANNIFDANKKKKYIHEMIEILDENNENMIENF
ncbi:carbamoyl-phosphate synthase L chain, ATP binding domain protein [Clostridioides difficile CD160]|nr:carbamoyl-phosphate synthase L chain, ATP binding domain protein [Clostridioides difficile CD160]